MLLELDPLTVNLVVGTVIPLLVGLVAKKRAPSGVKAILNAALSAVAGALLAAVDAGGTISLNDLATNIATIFISSTATHYGIWKPTGVSAKVQNKTAGFGLGRAVPVEECCAS